MAQVRARGAKGAKAMPSQSGRRYWHFVQALSAGVRRHYRPGARQQLVRWRISMHGPSSTAQNLSARVGDFLPPHQSIARGRGSGFLLAMIVAMAVRG